jgi:beta-lactamase class A
VFGLPRGAAPRPTGSTEDRKLAARVRALVRSFGGSAGVYVQDLRSGLGAAWNARARFPAASALKLAIAVETLRTLPSPPARGSGIDELLRSMLLYSDNAAANRLEVVIGGSTSGGSSRINAMLRAIGLHDTDMYGGYELDRSARAIPVTVESQPAIGNTKHSTAWDLARLSRAVYLAAGGRGPLRTRVQGFTPPEARYLLYLLLHVRDPGKLDRFLPPWTAVAHKAGWNSVSRSDNGIVFWPAGALVATVMTHSSRGVGTSADVLAGRVAAAGLSRFRSVAGR